MEGQKPSAWWAWISWGLCALFVLYQFLLQSSTSVMIPCLEKAFGIGAEGVGFLSSSFFWSYLILQIPSGIFIDRYGAKRILIFVVSICALAALIFAKSTALQTAEASRLLMGFASAPAVAAAMYVASQWFKPCQFAMVAGLTEMLGMLGGALGEAYLAQCVGNVGWRNTMVSVAFAGFVLAACIWAFVRDKPKQDYVKVLPASRSGFWKPLGCVLRMPQSWFIGLFAGLTFALIAAFAGLWAVPYLQVQYGFDLEKAAGASSLIFLGAAVGSPLIGWLSDCMGRRKPIMFITAFLCLLTMSALLYIPDLSHVSLYILLTALGLTSGAYVVPFAIMREITPGYCRGTAMGYTNMMAIIIGAPLLQPFIGFLLKHFGASHVLDGVSFFTAGSYQLALSVFPICLFLALVFLVFIKETRCREVADSGS